MALLSTISWYWIGYSDGTITFRPKGTAVIDDNDLAVEEVVTGLVRPTTMAFLGPDDILVLEKDNGKVQRIVNGNTLPEPVLDVHVSTTGERGMLGIAISKSLEKLSQIPPHVFLYFTESPVRDSEDSNGTGKVNEPLGNRLYRYEFVNNRLINPKLLLDLPALPGPLHNGGAIKISDEGYVYLAIGDVRTPGNIQKVITTKPVSGILRITQDGQPVPNGGILGDQYPLNLYYAYGIRNSFGMDFDAVTGNLWDTENGQWYGDEINLVEPGFNSGWRKVQGIWMSNNETARDRDLEKLLEDYSGKGRYRTPELTWSSSVGLTALAFINSDEYGESYENDMLIGDFHNGRIYRFSLDEDRTELSLEDQIDDKIVEENQIKNHEFGKGFGGISDIKMNPFDGLLYILSFEKGTIYRIVPLSN
jgi:aldose sugar dehydrogenase